MKAELLNRMFDLPFAPAGKFSEPGKIIRVFPGFSRKQDEFLEERVLEIRPQDKKWVCLKFSKKYFYKEISEPREISEALHKQICPKQTKIRIFTSDQNVVRYGI